MDLLARELSAPALREWCAFYLIEEGAKDPDVTKWDAKETIRRKLEMMAKSKRKR